MRLFLFTLFLIFSLNPNFLASQSCAFIAVENKEFDFVHPNFSTNALIINGNLVDEGRIPMLWFDQTLMQGVHSPIPDKILTVCFDVIATSESETAVQLIESLPTHFEVVTYTGSQEICYNQGLVNIVDSSTSPAPPNLIGQIFPANCFEGFLGAIETETFFGIAPYVYEWEGPNGFLSTNSSLTEIEMGNYQLTVTDNVGITTEHFFEVYSTIGSIPNAIVNRSDCGTSNTARIDLQLNSNNAPYLITGENGSSE